MKLIDFGLSKHVFPHEIMTQQVGSAYYVAPDGEFFLRQGGSEIWPSVAFYLDHLFNVCPEQFSTGATRKPATSGPWGLSCICLFQEFLLFGDLATLKFGHASW